MCEHCEAVENPLSLCNGKCTPRPESLEREGIPVVNSKVRWCPSSRTSFLKKGRKGAGKMKQHLQHFRNVSAGELCVKLLDTIGEESCSGLTASQCTPPKMELPVDAELLRKKTTTFSKTTGNVSTYH